MYLNLIFLLFCAWKIKSEEDSGEGKYIDLLPEEEKREFLEKVARRILEEVQSRDDAMHSSGEVSETQLDKHSEYVSKLLNEEKDNLSRRKNETKNSNDNKRDIRSFDDANNLKVKGVDNKKASTSKEDSDKIEMIDLTLRQRGESVKDTESETATAKFMSNSKIINDSIGVNNNNKKDKFSIEITIDDKSAENNSNTNKGIVKQSNVIPVQILYEDSIAKDKTYTKAINVRPKEPLVAENKLNENTGEGTTLTIPVYDFSSSKSNSAGSKETTIDNGGKNTEIMKSKDKKNNKVVHFSAKESNSVSEEVETNDFESKISDIVSFMDKSTEITTGAVETTIKSFDLSTKESSTVDSKVVSQEKSTIKEKASKDTSQQYYRKFEEQSSAEDVEWLKQNEHKYTKVTEIIGYEPETVTDSDEYLTKSNIACYESTTNLQQVIDQQKKETEKKRIEEAKRTYNTKDPDDFTQRIYEVIDMSRSNKNDNSSDNKSESNLELQSSPTINESESGTGFTKPYVSLSIDLYNDTTESTRVVSDAVESNPILNVKSKINENNLNVENKTSKNNSKNPSTEAVTTTIATLLTEAVNDNQSVVKTPLPIGTIANHDDKYLNTEPIFKVNNKQSLRIEDDVKIVAHKNIFGNVLRQGLYRDAAEMPNSNNYYELQSRHTEDKSKEYKVYEIPPGESPFSMKTPDALNSLGDNKRDDDMEPPYYVPVHNYAPNHAYFNPHNRLGPNSDDLDDNDDQIGPSALRNRGSKFVNADLDSIESRKSSLYERLNVNAANKPSNNMRPVAAKRPKVSDTYQNDYFDMDYYYGRSHGSPGLRSKLRKRRRKKKSDNNELKFPDSADLSHPYNYMNRGEMRNHISAVRQVMYQKNLFGYIPELTSSTVFRSKTISTTEAADSQSNVKRFLKSHNNHHKVILLPPRQIQNTLQKPPTEDIDMDYFYGRKSKETSEEMQRYVIRKPSIASSNNNARHDDKLHSHFRSKGRGKTRSGNSTSSSQIDNDFALLLNMTDSKDLVQTLFRLEMIARSFPESNVVNPYVNVMKDMIYTSSKGLVQYDWLSTAVDIQAALKKLLDLIKLFQGKEDLHPSDLELLKYIIYIYKTSENTLRSELGLKNGADHEHTYVSPIKHFFPKVHIKNKKGHTFIKNYQHLLRGKHENILNDFDSKINDFEEFLLDLQDRLNDLHDAVKHVSMVSKHKTLKMYKDLKDLYFESAKRKELLEVILHLMTTRLIDLVEESAVTGAEENYTKYIEENEMKVNSTLEECLFILRLLGEFRKIDD